MIYLPTALQDAKPAEISKDQQRYLLAISDQNKRINPYLSAKKSQSQTPNRSQSRHSQNSRTSKSKNSGQNAFRQSQSSSKLSTRDITALKKIESDFLANGGKGEQRVTLQNQNGNFGRNYKPVNNEDLAKKKLITKQQKMEKMKNHTELAQIEQKFLKISTANGANSNSPRFPRNDMKRVASTKMSKALLPKVEEVGETARDETPRYSQRKQGSPTKSANADLDDEDPSTPQAKMEEEDISLIKLNLQEQIETLKELHQNIKELTPATMTSNSSIRNRIQEELYRSNALKRETNKMKAHQKNIKSDQEYVKHQRLNGDNNGVQKVELAIQTLNMRYQLADKKHLGKIGERSNQAKAYDMKIADMEDKVEMQQKLMQEYQTEVLRTRNQYNRIIQEFEEYDEEEEEVVSAPQPAGDYGGQRRLTYQPNQRSFMVRQSPRQGIAQRKESPGRGDLQASIPISVTDIPPSESAATFITMPAQDYGQVGRSSDQVAYIVSQAKDLKSRSEFQNRLKLQKNSQLTQNHNSSSSLQTIPNLPQSQLGDYPTTSGFGQMKLQNNQTLEAARSAAQLSAANSIVEMSVNSHAPAPFNDYSENAGQLSSIKHKGIQKNSNFRRPQESQQDFSMQINNKKITMSTSKKKAAHQLNIRYLKKVSNMAIDAPELDSSRLEAAKQRARPGGATPSSLNADSSPSNNPYELSKLVKTKERQYIRNTNLHSSEQRMNTKVMKKYIQIDSARSSLKNSESSDQSIGQSYSVAPSDPTSRLLVQYRNPAKVNMNQSKSQQGLQLPLIKPQESGAGLQSRNPSTQKLIQTPAYSQQSLKELKDNRNNKYSQWNNQYAKRQKNADLAEQPYSQTSSLEPASTQHQLMLSIMDKSKQISLQTKERIQQFVQQTQSQKLISAANDGSDSGIYQDIQSSDALRSDQSSGALMSDQKARALEPYLQRYLPKSFQRQRLAQIRRRDKDIDAFTSKQTKLITRQIRVNERFRYKDAEADIAGAQIAKTEAMLQSIKTEQENIEELMIRHEEMLRSIRKEQKSLQATRNRGIMASPRPRAESRFRKSSQQQPENKPVIEEPSNTFILTNPGDGKADEETKEVQKTLETIQKANVYSAKRNGGMLGVSNKLPKLKYHNADRIYLESERNSKQVAVAKSVKQKIQIQESQGVKMLKREQNKAQEMVDQTYCKSTTSISKGNSERYADEGGLEEGAVNIQICVNTSVDELCQDLKDPKGLMNEDANSKRDGSMQLIKDSDQQDGVKRQEFNNYDGQEQPADLGGATENALKGRGPIVDQDGAPQNTMAPLLPQQTESPRIFENPYANQVEESGQINGSRHDQRVHGEQEISQVGDQQDQNQQPNENEPGDSNDKVLNISNLRSTNISQEMAPRQRGQPDSSIPTMNIQEHSQKHYYSNQPKQLNLPKLQNAKSSQHSVIVQRANSSQLTSQEFQLNTECIEPNEATRQPIVVTGTGVDGQITSDEQKMMQKFSSDQKQNQKLKVYDDEGIEQRLSKQYNQSISSQAIDFQQYNTSSEVQSPSMANDKPSLQSNYLIGAVCLQSPSKQYNQDLRHLSPVQLAEAAAEQEAADLQSGQQSGANGEADAIKLGNEDIKLHDPADQEEFYTNDELNSPENRQEPLKIDQCEVQISFLK